MNVRPFRPAPLVSRPRPAAPAAAPAWRWLGRWRIAAGVAAFSLAGLGLFGAWRASLLGGGAAPPVRSPEPSALLLVTPLQTPRPAVTFTPTPTELPTVAPTSTPTLLNDGIAKELVERYYALISDKDFQGAYALLGSDWRQRQGYEDFASGYRTTVRDTATVTGTALANKDKVRGYVVAIELDAQLTTRLQRYKGLYFVALEGSQPRIENGELSAQ
jgi:hypothetical protein